MIYQYASVATVMFVVWAFFDFYLHETTQYPSLFYLDRVQWFYIAIISLINTVSQFYATLAFQNGQAAFMSLISLMNVLYGCLIDVFIFKTEFNSLQVIGGTIITTLNVALIYVKMSNEKKADKIEH